MSETTELERAAVEYTSRVTGWHEAEIQWEADTGFIKVKSHRDDFIAGARWLLERAENRCWLGWHEWKFYEWGVVQFMNRGVLVTTAERKYVACSKCGKVKDVL